MTKKALIITHSARSQTNYVTTFFAERHIPFEILPIFDDQSKLVDIHTTDYLVIVSLGGPQGTYEEDLYPYLKWDTYTWCLSWSTTSCRCYWWTWLFR